MNVPSSVRVAALATVVGLRDSRGDFALDGCVPVRRDPAAASGADLEWRAYLVLSHVDGDRSLQAIAAVTALPVSEVVTACLELVSRGLLEVSS